jgi:hypothetical protein
MTLLKWFQRCHWHWWNHSDDKVTNFIGTSTIEFLCAKFQWCHWHRWNNFRGVIDTPETISAVSLTLLKWFQRCQWHCWNDLHGVNDTAEINVTPLKSQTDFSQSFFFYKGKIQQKYFDTSTKRTLTKWILTKRILYKTYTHAAYTHKTYTHTAYTVTKRILYITYTEHTVYSRIFSLWSSMHYSFKKSSHLKILYGGCS